MTLFVQHVGRPASLALFLSLASLPMWAQDGAWAKIDAYVRAEMEHRRIPGLALLIVRDHQVVFAANYGVANIALHTRVTDRTSFEIASMTKQFTDAAILLLAERGKLALTDPLSMYFPDLPLTWGTITIQQLMNHTAGLRDDWDEDDRFFTSKTTSGQFFEALKAAPLKFVPGSDWSYSCGPFVLGLLIERLTGKSYPQFMRESLFGPIGMASTVINGATLSVRRHASGYVMRNGMVQPGIRISPAARARADVGMRTTARDLALWDAALDSSSPLSAKSRALMFTPGRLSTGEVIAYGLGWYITPFRGHTEVMHGGSFRTGFNSVIARYPDDRLTIIVLTNLFKARSSEMARAIASFYNSDYRPIRMMQSRPDVNPSRTQVIRRIMVALKDGEKAEELLPEVGRLGGWSRAELRQELAHASSPTFVDCKELAGRHVTVYGTEVVANCFYRTEGDRLRYWTFSLTEDGRVAYVELEE